MGNHLTHCTCLNYILLDFDVSNYRNMEDLGCASKKNKELNDLISSVATTIDVSINKEN